MSATNGRAESKPLGTHLLCLPVWRSSFSMSTCTRNWPLVEIKCLVINPIVSAFLCACCVSASGLHGSASANYKGSMCWLEVLLMCILFMSTSMVHGSATRYKGVYVQLHQKKVWKGCRKMLFFVCKWVVWDMHRGFYVLVNVYFCAYVSLCKWVPWKCKC